MSDLTATDPMIRWEPSAWVLAAVVSAGRELADQSLAEVLAADPARADVLAAAGILDEVGGHTGLGDPGTAAHRSSARLASLRQALAVADGEPVTGWAAQPDQVLLEQGRASAATGKALASRLVPALPGLAERLATGGRVLDVGSGVGALTLALAEALPNARITGIDILPRAVELARAELDRAGATAQRVELSIQDVAALSASETYDLIWLPAPFLSPSALAAALPRVADALTIGGWLVVGTDPPPADDVAGAVARWQAARNAGSATDEHEMTSMLTGHGMSGVDRLPTVPGGPMLVVGRRVGSARVIE